MRKILKYDSREKCIQYLILALFIGVSSFIISVGYTEVLRKILEKVLFVDSQGLRTCLLYFAGMMVVFIGVKTFISVISFNICKEKTIKLEEKIVGQYSTLTNWNEREVIERFHSIIVNDIPNLANTEVDLFKQLIGNMFTAVFGIIYAFSINVICSVVCVVLVFVLYFLLGVTLKRMPEYEKLMGEKHNNNYSYIWNIWQNLAVAAFLNYNKMMEQFQINTKDIVDFSKKKSRLFANISLGRNILSTGVLIVVTMCAAVENMIFHQCSLAIPDIMALFLIIPQVVNALGELLQWFTNYKSYEGVRSRVEEINEKSVYEPKYKSDIKKIELLQFEKVTFGYTTQNVILENVNLSIRIGDVVLLHGNSGCGKSTVLKILLGLLDSYTGKILVNGKELREINRISLWKRCSYVGQETVVFNVSLKKNICMQEEVDEEVLGNIVKIVGIESIIERENSENKSEIIASNSLSSGEKQRLCLARALYKKDFDILILDEATSAIDPVSEIDIFINIVDYVKKNHKMLVFISHNDDMIKYADFTYRF